ncbi:MAG: DUF1848 domain-containing protein [Firmicutes bacterium]|nr:DUF1848 domain-containing protein [Bacillota bacterium]
MIISASRRTDIPAYYSDWFFNRVKEGFVLTRNPMNFRQVRRVEFSSDTVNGIVFWTKNPAPMFSRIEELQDFMYYFQYTVTPYGKDIEPNVLRKDTNTLDTFKKLSEIVGPDRVIWRYDPILINVKYTAEYHLQAFEKIAKKLCDYTHKVIISFIDTDYKAVKSNTDKLQLAEFPTETKTQLVSNFASIARSCGLTVYACAQKLNLQEFGVGRARCIDNELFEKLHGHGLNIKKDKNQRSECGCAASVDIGMYNTCLNGCLYCYANYIPKAIVTNQNKHNPYSAFIIDDSKIPNILTDEIQTL